MGGGTCTNNMKIVLIYHNGFSFSDHSLLPILCARVTVSASMSYDFVFTSLALLVMLDPIFFI